MSKGTGAAKITIIVDNKAAEGLLCEHGFAAWIEVAGRLLLFDTGQGAALAGNADRLGIDLRSADTLVLSHGHDDHTGGVPLFITRAPTADIYAHPAATGPRYSLRDGVAKPIAMPAAASTAIEAHPVGVQWATRSQQLAIGLGLTGPIFPTTGG